MSTCSNCGIKLTKDNAYSRSKEEFIPASYCKQCDNLRRKMNYDGKNNFANNAENTYQQ